jgi:hypothetical protein
VDVGGCGGGRVGGGGVGAGEGITDPRAHNQYQHNKGPGDNKYSNMSALRQDITEATPTSSSSCIETHTQILAHPQPAPSPAKACH